MDFQWLLTFDRIQQAGTFAKAAESLGYSQSSVTFQIRQLECELSAKLFDKVGNKMVLSSAGQAVAPIIHDVILSIEELKRVACQSDEPKGQLNVAVSVSIFEYTTLYNIIYSFISQAPLVNLNIAHQQCSDIIENVKQGNCDIGIFYQVAGEEDPMLDIVRLLDIPIVLIASSAPVLEWDSLKMTLGGKRPELLTDSRCAFRRMYRRYLKKNNLPMLKELNLGSLGNMMEGVQDSLGIALAPIKYVEKEINEGRVRVLPVKDIDETVYIALGTHKNRWKNSAVHLFTELCKDGLKQKEN